MTSKKFLILVKKFFPGSTILPPEDKKFEYKKFESERITLSQAGRILSSARRNKRNKNFVDKNQLTLI